MYKFIGIKTENTIDFQMLKKESTLDLKTEKDRKCLITVETKVSSWLPLQIHLFSTSSHECLLSLC